MDLDALSQRIDSRPVHHLPLVASIVDRLHIPDVVDEHCPMDPRSRVSHGQCVKLMILNILQGRVALYRMDGWLDRTDCEVLLGPNTPSDAFSDARLAAALDSIHEAGPDNVFSGVMLRYLQAWRAMTGSNELSLHTDTSSASVHGAYEDQDEAGPTPTFGFSKDHRPDLKQLIFGLTLHGATRMPLYGTVLDGNTADCIANRLHIESLAELLDEDQVVTVVGDAKLVDELTLRQLAHHGWHFVSLLPNSFAVRRELVEQVRESGEGLPVLWEGPGRTKGEIRRYRGRSFEAPLWKGKRGKGRPYRMLVVQSDQLVARFEAALPAKLTREKAAFEKSLGKLRRKGFACEADARQAAIDLSRRHPLLRGELGCEVEHVRVKRDRPGRPRRGEKAVTKEVWRPKFDAVEADPAAVEEARFHASHFVLVTDHLDRAAWPDERVLEEYRHQHAVEGHTGFRWLKSGVAVTPMFLKKTTRIAALGMVLVLALAVRNYIQYELRRRLAETGSSVDDRKRRPTQKPTTETALLGFEGLMILRLWDDGKIVQRRVQGLDDHCRTVLEMLGLSEDVFNLPSARKPLGVGGRTLGM